MNAIRSWAHFITTAAVVFGLLICIAASGNPRDAEAFLNGLFVMVVAIWIRQVFDGERADG